MSSALDDLVSSVRDRAGTTWIGRHIRAFDTVSSTNSLARDGVLRGEPSGTLYLAENQTEGRGRLGRRWVADAGVNLTFSLILRPPLEYVGLMGILSAVALRRALSLFVTPQPIHIKWPNDLLVEGMKCTGMLMENVTQGANPGVVVGIGVNVNQTSFSPVDAPNATSLLLATGRHVPRADLLAVILVELEDLLDSLDELSLHTIIQEYQDHMYRRGERVRLYLSSDGRAVEGIMMGIRPSGALRLRTQRGDEEFYAGDVTTQNQTENVG